MYSKLLCFYKKYEVQDIELGNIEKDRTKTVSQLSDTVLIVRKIYQG